MFIKFKLLLAITLLLCVISQAQVFSNDTLEVQRNVKGEINFARFKFSTPRKIRDGNEFLKSLLKMKNIDSLSLIKESIDKLGITHQKYQQIYKGVKVENSEYLIHGKDGVVETVNGDFHKIDISSVVPKISEKDALLKSLVYVGAKKYKWENLNSEEFLKKITGNNNATYYPKGELVISKNYKNGSKNLELSWRFIISSFIPKNEQIIYVNAFSGAIINDVSLIIKTRRSSFA